MNRLEAIKVQLVGELRDALVDGQVLDPALTQIDIKPGKPMRVRRLGLDLCCARCGRPLTFRVDGTRCHLVDDAAPEVADASDHGVDHDADANHVPVATDGPQVNLRLQEPAGKYTMAYRGDDLGALSVEALCTLIDGLVYRDPRFHRAEAAIKAYRAAGGAHNNGQSWFADDLVDLVANLLHLGRHLGLPDRVILPPALIGGLAARTDQ